MQYSPFILHPYYDIILNGFELMTHIAVNQHVVNGGGEIRKQKWQFYFSVLLKIITFAVYSYRFLRRNGSVQILQNPLIRIVYYDIV